MKTILKLVFSIVILAGVIISCEKSGLADDGFGVLEGTVVSNGDNVPLENVKITTNPASTTVFSNAEGKFRIDNILTGEYSVQAELEDYVTGFEPATIALGQTSNVVFELDLTSTTNLPPLKPILDNPANDATDVPINVEFRWSNSMNDDDIINYSFELRNGTTNEVIMDEEVADTMFSVQNLELNRNYFWQVTASDNVNDPVASDLGNFTTASETTNRFFYVRQEGDNSVIFSGDNTDDATANENEIQLTSSETNSFRPRAGRNANKIAFLRSVGAETHIFTMNRDGTDVNQVTSTVPVAGFRTEEIDFTWARTGNRLFYPSFGSLYQINANGSGLIEVYQAPSGTFITEVDSNGIDNLLAIKTNDINGYNARISIINPSSGIELNVLVEGEPGAHGGLDYSIDGTKVLYTRDVSGFEGPEYRPLDSHIFIYDIIADDTIDLSDDKPVGTNDLDPKYSPDEGAVIFMNTSNDGVSPRNIFTITVDDTSGRPEIFTDAFMPDWK